MNGHELTPVRAKKLAELLIAIRPDWSLHFTLDAVLQMPNIDADLEHIIAAAVRGALTPSVVRKPDVLRMGGDHWKAVGPDSTAVHVVQDKANSCDRCHTIHTPACPCPPQRRARFDKAAALAVLAAARSGHSAKDTTDA